MKRKFALSLLLLMLLSLALPLCAHAASGGSLGYVTDSAGLLTDEQRAELEDMAAGISEKYRCGVYIVTTQDYTEFGRGSIESCAEEIYDRYLIGFGETGDGILFLVSMADRDYDLDAHGSFGNYAFSSRNRDLLVDAFAPYFRGTTGTTASGPIWLRRSSSSCPRWRATPPILSSSGSGRPGSRSCSAAPRASAPS